MNLGSLFHIDPSWMTIFQMGIRVLLAAAMGVAALLCVSAAFQWIYWEENALVAHESKNQLGKMLVIITALFVLMALFRLWVPTYASLSY